MAPERQLIDNLSAALVLLDRHLCVQYLNTAAEVLFDVSRRQLNGLSIYSFMSEKDLSDVNVEKAVHEGVPFTERERLIELPHDRVATVDIVVTPIQSEGSSHVEQLLLEFYQIDRHIQISRDEHLVEQQQITRNLIRSLAHEVKNPLGGLRGAAQLLERELEDKDLKEFTQVIIHEADRLQALVDRLLGPNKVPTLEEVNTLEVLERVIKLVTAETQQKVKFVRDYDPSLPEVHASFDQIMQVVLNITRNALQAMGGEGEIVFRTRAQRQFTIGHIRHRIVLRIDIEDNGPGIPTNMIEHIFLPMVTGRSEGSGLGLSIAQTIISKHGGFIGCESRPGFTQFSIYLPLETSYGAN